MCSKININIENEIIQRLKALQDPKNKEFSLKLKITLNPDNIFGVRTPELKKLAKEFRDHVQVEDFLQHLPHKYFEENKMHACIIENIQDYEKALLYTKKFLPYIDNWAICDCFKPKVFKKYPDEFYEELQIWLQSENTYTVRFAIINLMRYYLDENFKNEMLDLVSEIDSGEYYINMAIAWYFSTALVKQYEATIPIFENTKLDKFVHNTSIQKALESFRIDNEIKKYLKTLKI